MDENKLTTLNKNATLKQSNSLVDARYRLTTYEQRIIIAICSQLTSETVMPKIRINVNDLADFCKFPASKKLDIVRTTTRKLRSRTLEYLKSDKNWYITGWINSAELLDDGTIEFSIDEKLTPHLLQLKSAYLATSAAPLMEFKFDYTARIYFLLKKMLKIHEFDYTIDYIRERFCLSKSYQLFANLKNKILEPSLKEINEKSDITVDYSYVKSGRSYKKIHFVVTLKNQEIEKKEAIKKFENPVNTRFREHTVEENDIIIRLMKYDISPKHAERYLKKFGVAHIERNLKFAYKNKKNKSNISGWIIKCICDDLAAVSEKTAQMYKEEQEREKQKQYERMHSRTHPIFDKIPDKTDGKTAENSERKNSDLQHVSEILDHDFLKFLPENMRKNKNKD